MAVTFGQVLKQFRLARGFTQQDLGDRAGLSPTYISRLEYGDPRYGPRRETIETIGRALRLDQENSDRLVMSAGYLPQDIWEKLLKDLTSMPRRMRRAIGG